MEAWIVILPLIGALIAGLGKRRIGDKPAMYITSGLLLISMVLSWITFFETNCGGAPKNIELFQWFSVGDFKADFAVRVDQLSAVMLIVVTTVSAMVHVYSIGYMGHDHSKPRFFAYLSLFTFAMLMLVTADNFVQMFFGWEGVGLCSYLLIGFSYDRPSANAAAIKAFVVNRIGDFGFALGIFAVYSLFGSLHFDAGFGAASGMVQATFDIFGAPVNALTVTSILLFIGAMG